MITPKISVIVPIYNVEKYLDRCVQSLQNQTLKDIEIILVNDGSPDNCPRMCDSYAQEDTRVKVIHKINEGLGFARNSGMKIAQGEYIAFVDSDDFVEPTMYEKLYSKANDEDLCVVYSNFNKYSSEGVIIPCREVDKEFVLHDKREICQFLLNMIGMEPSSSVDRKYSMSVWRAIYSRSVISKHSILFRSEREMISEDIVFHVDFLPKIERLGYLAFCGYYYCENVASLTKTYRDDRFDKYNVLHKELLQKMTNAYSENWDVITRSVDRLFLGYIRRNILKGHFPKDVFSQKIKSVLNDEYLQQVLHRYPIIKLPIRYRLFYYALIYKSFTGINLLRKLLG